MHTFKDFFFQERERTGYKRDREGERERERENETEETRSCIGALRDDSMGESRDDNPNVILTMLLVRIPAFREKGTLSYS